MTRYNIIASLLCLYCMKISKLIDLRQIKFGPKFVRLRVGNSHIWGYHHLPNEFLVSSNGFVSIFNSFNTCVWQLWELTNRLLLKYFASNFPYDYNKLNRGAVFTFYKEHNKWHKQKMEKWQLKIMKITMALVSMLTPNLIKTKSWI